MSVLSLANTSVTVYRKTNAIDDSGSDTATGSALYSGAICHAHEESGFETFEAEGIKRQRTVLFNFPDDLALFMDDYIDWGGVKYQVTQINRRIKPGGIFSHLEVRGEAVQNGTI